MIFGGFRYDINEILKAADVFVFPSFQEGLPVSVMEAMAAGLPVICSDIRGNRDLIDKKGGFLVKPDDVHGICRGIDKLAADPELRSKMGAYNKMQANKYDIHMVLSKMQKIYERILQDSL